MIKIELIDSLHPDVSVMNREKRQNQAKMTGLYKCDAMNCQTVKAGANSETIRCYEQILSH
jgi:hypothetical protein